MQNESLLTASFLLVLKRYRRGFATGRLGRKAWPHMEVFLRGQVMRQEEEIALKVTKEIVIKFIEIGRLSVSSFDEVFRQVHTTVVDTLAENAIKAAE